MINKLFTQFYSLYLDSKHGNKIKIVGTKSNRIRIFYPEIANCEISSNERNTKVSRKQSFKVIHQKTA